MPLSRSARSNRAYYLALRSMRGQMRRASNNAPGLGSLATPTPMQPPRKRHLLRSTLLWSSLILLSGYGGGAYLTTTNDRVRHFYTESLPLGRLIVDAIDDRSLKSLGAAPGQSKIPEDSALQKARQKAQENAKLAAQKRAQESKQSTQQQQQPAANKVEQAISAIKGESVDIPSPPQKAVAGVEKLKSETAKTVSDAADKVSTTMSNVKVEAKQMASTAVAAAAPAIEKAKEVVNDTVDSTKNLISDTEKALGLPARSTNESILPTSSAETAVRPPTIDKAGNRQLDPTPLPAPEPYGLPYTGPPLPLGFEPPPGYYIPKKNKPAAARPEPLPLIGPKVSKFGVAAEEPILSQLAGTIDSLASYVGTTPQTSSDKVKKVLTTAESDLQALSERLGSIKDTEHQKLQDRLDEQQKTYTDQLATKEKELFDRLEAQESDWQASFEAERQNLVASYRAKLDKELATQKEIIDQRLKEEVVAQGIAMQRKWLQDIKHKVEEERGGRLAKLDKLHDDVQKLSKVTMDNDSYLDASLKVNRLFSTVKAAQEAEGRPLTTELRALQELAGEEPLIKAALSAIPKDAVENGIKPLSYLSAWFNTSVSSRIKAAALMPDHGGFLSYFTSATLSPFLFSRTGPTEGDDVMSVLSRAQHYLDLKDVGNAAREINQLKGWPKILARDWLEACRRHCEVKQALQIAENEAKIKSFVVV